LLKWLLQHRAGITLAILTGLMFGSLRALWPWQTEDRDLLAPDSLVIPALLIGALGAGFVVVLLLVERRLGISEEQTDEPALS
jgi:putative membrane protein